MACSASLEQDRTQLGRIRIVRCTTSIWCSGLVGEFGIRGTSWTVPVRARRRRRRRRCSIIRPNKMRDGFFKCKTQLTKDFPGCGGQVASATAPAALMMSIGWCHFATAVSSYRFLGCHRIQLRRANPELAMLGGKALLLGVRVINPPG